MIIVNSKQYSNKQYKKSINSQNKNTQFQTINHILQQQQKSVLQWINQRFDDYPHCKKVKQIEDLYNGIALGQILSQFLPSAQLQQEILNSIEMTNLNYQICLKNLNSIINTLKMIFDSCLIYKQKTSNEQNQIVKFVLKKLSNIKAKHIFGNKFKMIQFFIQIIMVLPQIQSLIYSSANQMIKRIVKKPNQIQNENSKRQYDSAIGIQQLSSINYCSTGTNNGNYQKAADFYRQNYEPKLNEENQQNLVYHYIQEQRISKILTWIAQNYCLSINQLNQPHYLLGQLINAMLAGNRLSQNQKLIKPVHYELGPFAVYKKVINILESVERMSKQNLIKLIKQIQQGQVKQNTYWSLIQDLYSMTKNKISFKDINFIQKKQKSLNKNKTIELKQNQNRIITQSQFDQNINLENIKTKTMTDLLKGSLNQKNSQNKLINSPLYQQRKIKQTQLWLQQDMGMGYSLNKAKSMPKNVTENPLLNGILFSKIIQRLKIGSAKGVINPTEQKHIKSNIEIIKNQLLKRGYQCARKLNIYKPTYNFYIGLMGQIREMFNNKESVVKKCIINDKKIKKQIEILEQIQEKLKQQMEKWLQQDYNITILSSKGQLILTLNNLKTVIQSTINISFLRQTTQKIRYLNYEKLLQFFRDIGFSQYYHVNVQQIINQNSQKSKRTQNIRWMILRDLKIIKGSKFQGYSTSRK